MRKFFLIPYALLFCCACTAQNNPPKELHFNHLFVEDGLPEGRILALLQDKEGYIWAGTQNGLVRYDGYKAKVYKFGLDGNCMIRSIFEDRNGELWVGTYSLGIYKYNRTIDSFMHFKPGTKQQDSGGFWMWIDAFEVVP